MPDPAPQPLEAIVFDVDGTLAETERLGHLVAYNQAFDDLGAEWEWSDAFYGDLLRIEGGAERLDHYLYEYRPEFSGPEDRAAFVDDAHGRKNTHYRRLLDAGEIPLRPGIRRLIDEARAAGLRLAIASSSVRANVFALLNNELGEDADDLFDAIVTGDDVSRKKPDPEVYRRVLDRLDLPAAACIAIEDSENGCLAAVRCGLPTIVTVSSYTGAHEFPGSLLVADSLGEPDQPWHVIAGSPGGATHLDVATLRRLHAQARHAA